MKYHVDNVKNFPEYKGWLCGQFFPAGHPLKNDALEVKIATLKTGETYPEHYHPVGKEMVLIIEGEIEWLIDDKKVITRKNDFLFMENNLKEEVTKVVKPTRLITIRTPSVPDNKIETK